jgi:filamentous hemagglutinin
MTKLLCVLLTLLFSLSGPATGANGDFCRSSLAANSGLEGAVFAQKTFGQTFSSGGKFAGQTIDDVAGSLRSGSMRAGDVPIEYIVRDGNTLMLNTRSAQALQQAGVPRSQWNAVNMTGNAAAEARLTGQLQRNGLGSGGIPNPTQSGR